MLLPAFVLLARSRPDEALELAARQRIFDVVKDRPGIHFSDVVREVDYAPTTVRYHLTVLEREGLVTSLDIGRYLRYYPRERGEQFRHDAQTPEEKRALAVLRQRVPLAVAVEILVNGERTHGPLAQAVGVSPSTLTHHLQKMQAAGMVLLEKRGRETRIRLADPEAVRGLLKRYPPKPDLVDAFVDLFEGVGL